MTGNLVILDRFGGIMIDQTLSLMGINKKPKKQIKNELDAFHEAMRLMEVRAYRYDDGLVDRINHEITFSVRDRYKGCYYGNLFLLRGDKIFIGNRHDGGKYAVIEKIVKCGFLSTTYHYSLIEEQPRKKDRWFNRFVKTLKYLIWESVK